LASDPTRPQLPGEPTINEESSSSAPIKPSLTGIFKRNGKYFAIIEGKNYKKGDYYRNHQLTQIDNDSVQLSSKNGTINLRLIPKVKNQSYD